MACKLPHTFLLLCFQCIAVVIATRSLPVISGPSHLRLPWDQDAEDATKSWQTLDLVRLNNGLAQTPQMGWNSWNHFGCNVTEAVVRATADEIISSGLASVGYNYINIDDCWAALQRDPQGLLTSRPTTFPSGIQSLADYVHSKGLKLGIYSDAGFFTCARQPGSLFHEPEDANTFASWGVDYLKYDNCFDDLTPPTKRYPPMTKALNKTGRPIFLSMCEWGVDDPALWARDLANSWRTTQDIQDNWSSMITIADQNNLWADFAGPGGWNDPDMLEVGNGGMSTSEYRVHFSLWALMKAPLLIGCDITKMTTDTKNIVMNKEVIAINQDSLGVQGRKVCVQSVGEEIWAGPISGGQTVVALVNRGSETADIVANWSDLGLPPHLHVSVRDLWQHQSLEGDYSASVTATVAPHDVALFLLTPRNG